MVAPASPATSFSVTGVDSKLSLWRRLFDSDALITGRMDVGDGGLADFHEPTSTEFDNYYASIVVRERYQIVRYLSRYKVVITK